MADELRRFLEALPVRNVHESQIGDSIYVADGELCVGGVYYPVGIRVWFHNGRIAAQVTSPKAHVSVYVDQFDPSGTAELVRLAVLRKAS